MANPFEVIETTATIFTKCGIEYDTNQLITVMRQMHDAGTLKVTKGEPVDPARAARNDEMRRQIGDWLMTNPPPSYTGDRATAATRGEILNRIGIPVDRTSTAIIKALLDNPASRFHEWGSVAVVDGLTLYARTARLIEFRRAA